MGEFEFIDKIKGMFAGIGAEHAIEGIGDDCAVIAMDEKRSMVITTDMLVEGSHFLMPAVCALELGRKSLAVNLSDVAAMGAKPVAALLSLGLPSERTGVWAEEFMEGIRELASTFDVALIGGDTTISKCGVVINIVAIGIAPNQNIKRRSSARIGDLVVVAGLLGDSAAGLRKVMEGDYTSALAKLHHNPSPQVTEGKWLGCREQVHAMIDISDGLASDLRHILKASGVGAHIDLENIPTSHSLEDALCGGEDYKLLFTVEPDDAFFEKYRREVGELYVIGRIVEGDPVITWLNQGRVVDGNWHGFHHF